jgi:putative membrane protein
MPLRLYSIALAALLALSAWRTHDLPTWTMEVAPVFIVLPLIWATHRAFRSRRCCWR